MKNRYIEITFAMICILTIMIISYAIIPKFITNDLFFDIKTGKTIFTYGVDFKDHFSFIPNLIYIYHHFLFDVIMYLIYESFSFFGISIFFTIISTLFGIVVFFVSKKYTNSSFIALCTSLITIFLTYENFLIRVQTITFLLFYLQLYFSEQLYKTYEKKYSILIILNSILIANLHMPLWIFSVLLYLPFLVESVFNILSNKIKVLKLVETENTKHSLIIVTFILLLLTGLVTPLKLYPYIFFTKSLFNNTYDFILEMQKTQLFYEIYVVMLTFFIIVSLYLKVIKIKIRDFFLIIGLFLFSLIAIRNIVYFYIFIPTIYVKSINIKSGLKFKIPKKINLKIINTVSIILLIVTYITMITSFDYKKYDYGISDYPVETVDYIKKNLDYKNVKIFNDFNYGPYLLFKDIPVFIDSRAEVYIKEFNGGYDIMGDYELTYVYKYYKKVFKKYSFDYAITYKNYPLYSYLKNDNDFEKIYEEKNKYALFKKIN